MYKQSIVRGVCVCVCACSLSVHHVHACYKQRVLCIDTLVIQLCLSRRIFPSDFQIHFMGQIVLDGYTK